jgi:NACHT domain-containing protein
MPDTDFWSDVCAKVLVGIAEKLAGKAEKYVTDFVAWVKQDFSEYLTNALESCSRVKIALRPDKPVELSSVYVSTKFSSDDEDCDDVQLIEQLPLLKRIVVIGTAGSGKSIFMRHLFLALFERSELPIPLYIELKTFNAHAEKDLLAFIFHSITKRRAVVTHSRFIEGLDKGGFCLVLDGFDEIEFDRRADVERQILELADRYPDVRIVLSSRPDECFNSWTKFTSFHVRPMERGQIVALIEKIAVDDQERTRAFVKELKGPLFDKHRTFLSNPLLAILMLMTYSPTHGIPDKLHTFYETSVQNLFFRRPPRMGLTYDEFRNCVARFSFESFRKGEVLFPTAELRDLVKKAIDDEAKVGGGAQFKGVDADNFMRDLIENFCILQRDGLYTAFSHKSLQEYFASYFIINRMRTQHRVGALERFCKRGDENLLKMIFNMKQVLIEREWVLEKLAAILAVMAAHPVKAGLYAHARAFYGDIRIATKTRVIKGSRREEELHVIIFDRSETSDLLRVILALYSDESRELRDTYFRQYMRRQKAIDKGIDALRTQKDPRAERPRFALRASDDSWLKATWIAAYLSKQEDLVLTLAQQAAARVKADDDSLDALTD